MKRSEINAAIRTLENLAKQYSFALPPFCGFTPENWKSLGSEYNEVRDNMLGWDVTDYGEGRFETMGFTLITLRNGNLLRKDAYPKPYAEKLLMLKDGQYSPMHFHWNKMEDIINRGGGMVRIKVYNADGEEGFAGTEVRITKDGRSYYVPAGSEVSLAPGESITIYPYMYHDFSVVPSSGDVLLGEVSMVNDDKNDNRFYESFPRFSQVEEDEAPYRLLCNEYPSV